MAKRSSLSYALLGLGFAGIAGVGYYAYGRAFSPQTCSDFVTSHYKVDFVWNERLSSLKVVDTKTEAEVRDRATLTVIEREAEAIVGRQVTQARVRVAEGHLRLELRGCEPHLVRWYELEMPNLQRLFTAAELWNLEEVRVLLSKGADVNARDPRTGRTALMMAIADPTKAPTEVKKAINFKMDARTLDVLLKGGADPNLTDDDGTTALMIAAWNGNLETAKSLLAFDANPMSRNKRGETARDLAISRGHLVVASLLSKHMTSAQ